MKFISHEKRTGRKILSALLAAAIVIGNSPIGQTNVYAESVPETEVTVSETEEATPETEEPEDFPHFNDSSDEDSLIQAYAELDFTYEENDTGITITKYTGDGGAVTIPSEIDGKKVTLIGEFAFDRCENLTSVTIPSSVISIGEQAFSNCTGLKSITISFGVTSIGKLAFADCTNLTSVDIPNSVTEIGDYAFYDCTSLTGAIIPNSATTIGVGAFDKCKSLKSVTIPNSITEIDTAAFRDCTSLASITIPNSVISIGQQAFSGCTSLTSVTIPNSVTSIKTEAFSYCTSLTSVTIPNSITWISWGCFNSCSNLISIVIPSNVTGISRSAFRNCTSLTSIMIPNSVTEIFINAFSGCENLIIYGESGSYAETFAKKQSIPFAPLVPALPAIKSTTADNQVALSWSAVDGAKKYRVFTYLNSKFTQVGETAATSFVVKALSGGTKYGFLVLAYNGSTWSKYTVDDVVYATPTGLVKPVITVTPAKNQATVKWSAVSGAKKYRIFTYLNSKFTQVGETTSTSYVVPGLSGKTKYGFLVLAYDGSAWSTYTANDVVYATPTGIAKPVFTVTAGKNQATVKWNAVSGAKKYRIFTYLNGKYTQVGETTSTSYVVPGLSGGAKYGFLVLAYDGSTWTTYKTTLDVVYATPTGIAKPAFTVTPGKNQAAVKWNAVSGAKKYRVFTYLNGKYTQAGETTSTSRVISGLTGGTKYGFLVLAYDGSTWTTYKTTLDVVYATPSK